MQKSEPNRTKANFGLQEILFVLFKHKWKIMVSSALGFAAAATVYVTRTPIYESHGKILINYVLQRGGIDAHENEMETSGRSGDQVINTELEILRSGDLAAEVAEAVGVDRFLPGASGPAALAEAAWIVRSGLQVAQVSKGSNVVLLTYRHRDPQLARDVLQGVMNLYPNKHLEIHRSVGAFEAVAQQTAEVRERLTKTEAELNRLKSESGIISVEEESLSFAAQRDKIKQSLDDAKAEREAQAARVATYRSRLVGDESSDPSVDSKSGGGELENPAHRAPRPQDVEEYRELGTRLEQLQERDFELQGKYASGSPLIARNQSEIARIKARRNAMLSANPELASSGVTETGAELMDPRAEFQREQGVLNEIEARIESYRASLSDLEARFQQLSTIGPRITELERRKQMEDAEYRLLESNLKKAQVDRNLDPTKLSNLRVVDPPSIPTITFSDLEKKIILGLAGAGVAIGLGLAFLIELVVDRRIKRPTEIETRLQVPLMLSIPYVRPKNRGAHLIAHHEPGEGNGRALPALRNGNGPPGPFGHRTDHFIHPYSEAIRDRIVFNFQINNMTHKPKMMAVTGLSAGSGTSTIAAGLAKAFSEVNGAKVLLVDLNSRYPEDNPMFGDKPLHSLAGALQTARNTRFKEGTQNLYLASAAARAGDSNAVAFGPMHLYEMLPHFRASEFDYVIFDMPPMDQTSPTLAMAGLMDKVLLVVDGEDTDRDTLKWGYSELVKGRADVSCVFNKARTHAPRWVAGEG